MARTSLLVIPPTVVYNHPNNSDASSLYLDGNPEPLRRQPTPEVQQPQIPRQDLFPRLRRKSAIRGSLRMCDDSLSQLDLMQRSTEEPQPPQKLSDISLGRQITSGSSESWPNAQEFGAELTRAPHDTIPQAGVFIRKRRRRSAGTFHQLKRCLRCPFQDSSSSTEEPAPPRLRVISNERCRPRSIGWPSRLDLANRPTERAYSSLPPPNLEAIPRISSDIASWLSELPDFTSNDALVRPSETMLKVATPASLPGTRSKQEEQVKTVQNEEESTTDSFCY